MNIIVKHNNRAKIIELILEIGRKKIILESGLKKIILVTRI